tara:strand:- start:24 stop:191 length:168 start_codon:yes stop_codon:yes gene_type:complete
MGTIKDSLTFDDVTLVPQYSSVLPVNTITESKMAIALSKSGGIGVIYRNLSIKLE